MVKLQETSAVRNLEVETETPVQGEVTGEIPLWLNGALLRNGAGVIRIGNQTMNHLFDGMAVIHRFEISNGKATYQNRILKSNTYLESKAKNRLAVSQFGTLATPDPCQSTLGRYMSRFELPNPDDISDNCNVNVCYYGDELYAITESPKLRRIDPETLETIGDEFDLGKTIAVNLATAHPHVDEDGTTYNMGNSFGPKGITYNIIKFPPGPASLEKGKIVSTIPSPFKTKYGYYHSFAITDNYFVFIQQPLYFQFLKMLTYKIRNSSVRNCFQWDSKQRARFSVVDRKTGQEVKTIYEAEGFMLFHHVNAYEKDGHLVVDVCAFKDDKVLDDVMIAKLNSTDPGDFEGAKLTRYVLPLNPKAPVDKSKYGVNLIKMGGTYCKSYWINKKVMICEPDQISSHSIELPRINYLRNGKYYRYAFGIHFLPHKNDATKIIKIDMETRNTMFWEREGFSVSEPIFVARPNATEEDDGYLLFSAVHNEDDKLVMLVVLDAATFKEAATVIFTAKGAVTKDFHGVFAGKDEPFVRF